MRVLSVCSGIGAAELAFTRLGMSFAASADIEPFPNAVRAVHFPEVPNWGDMTKFQEWPDADVNVLVGGTPCQSFSVAGLRKGLADPRGNLALTFLAIAARYAPRWVLWENVPGVLSSNGGRDFGSFLGGLAELGYGFAYRVLDAQFFGVAQRRRRVFVVGHLGDWRPAAAVLFERESLRGDPAPRRKAGQRVAALTSTGVGTCGADDNQAQAGRLIPQVSPTLRAGGNRTGGDRPPGTDDDTAESLIVTMSSGRANAEINTDNIAPTLRAMGHADSHANGGGQLAVVFAQNQRDELRTMDVAGALAAKPGMKQQTYVAQPAVFSIVPQNSGKDYKAREVDVAQPLMTSPVGGNQGGDYVMQPAVAYTVFSPGNVTRGAGAAPNTGGVAPTLKADHGRGASDQFPHIAYAMAVRRLTPVECARLQGFPDDYLNITYRGKPAADGPKYKALGNSMAVPVMSWLGGRIQMVDAMLEAA